jgi:hypothetical protein
MKQENITLLCDKHNKAQIELCSVEKELAKYPESRDDYCITYIRAGYILQIERLKQDVSLYGEMLQMIEQDAKRINNEKELAEHMETYDQLQREQTIKDFNRRS